MVSPTEARELIASLINRGESLDSHDMTILYGWIYSSYLALEPFPTEHRKFCRTCLDSFDPPRKRFQIGLTLLRTALKEADKGLLINSDKLSEDYKRLLKRVLEWTRRNEK